MTRISGFIRNAPKLFYVVAVLDFLKYVLPLAQLYFDGRFAGMDYEMGIKLQLFTTILTGIIFAIGWVAYGVITTLLVAIYDEVVALRAVTGDASNA